MYRHYDSESHLFSLHDCHAEKISFQDDTLSFYFPDGIWILDQHPKNTLHQTVRSDASQVNYHISDGGLDGISVFIFSQTGPGTALREDWEPMDFMNAVNSGVFHVELITQYQCYQSLLYKCWIWFAQNACHKECEMMIDTDQVTYCWNNICGDRVW